MEVVELAKIESMRLGSLGSCLICVITGAPSLATLDLLEKVELDFIAKHGKISSLWVVVGAGGKIDNGLGGRAKLLWDKVQGNLIGSAIVIASKGLAAVTVRAFLAGLFLLFRLEAPLKPFHSTAEGAGWLLDLPGQPAGQPKGTAAIGAIDRFVATSA